jgi:hypothetical protein
VARRRPIEVVAFEYRSGVLETPLLTVITPDQYEALDCVYLLGFTSKDIRCGIVDVVPITREDAIKMGMKP